MPARDILHDIVKDALISDGWTITHDPFLIPFGRRKLYADLGAERIIAAEQGEQKIVIEIKSFIGLSRITELQKALGQYILYNIMLSERYPDYELFIAMDEEAFNDLFQDADGRILLQKSQLRLFTVDLSLGVITQWIR